MADGLAQIIKHRHTGDDLRNLFLELEMVGEYVAVMNIRFDDKFIVDYDVHDELVECLVPGLVLQPVVENALLHGLQNTDGEARLHISGYIEDDAVFLVVFDNGIGISSEKLNDIQQGLNLEQNLIGHFPEPGLSGVALSNIQRRIRLWFGNAYGLSIDSTPHEGTTVIIRLPIIRE